MKTSPSPPKPPIGQAPGKKKAVAAMFDSIAPRYDLLNRILSAGIDQQWRRKAVDMLKPYHPQRILDIATGTGDLAIMAARRLSPKKVVGVDISEQMLRIGQQKIAAQELNHLITLQKGDSEKLPFSDNQFDAVLVAFGVRNFENLSKGLSEMHRVLKPGGHVVILEFSHPRRFPIRQLYSFYAHHILPRIGQLFSKNEAAYQYLPESVEAFPDGTDFLKELTTAGFTHTQWHPLTFGIASIYTAEAT